jgi:hypothetical protein
MAPNDPSWREFRSKFGRGLTWREFLGYIRDDQVMKLRLAGLIAVAAFGIAGFVSLVMSRWLTAAACYVIMLVLAFMASTISDRGGRA